MNINDLQHPKLADDPLDVEVTIDEDGVLQCLAPEDFELSRLGDVKVRRASRVEWDEKVRAWAVTLMSGRLLGWFGTRAQAIEAEVRYLNERIDAGTIEEVFSR